MLTFLSFTSARPKIAEIIKNSNKSESHFKNILKQRFSILFVPCTILSQFTQVPIKRGLSDSIAKFCRSQSNEVYGTQTLYS